MEGYLTHRNDLLHIVSIAAANPRCCFFALISSCPSPSNYKKMKRMWRIMNFGQVLTAMVTPFDQNGEIDFNATRTLVNHLIANGTDGISSMLVQQESLLH